MKHAFLIVAHNSPELLGLIAKKLESPDHYLYIHVDKKVDMTPFRDVCKGLENCKIYQLIRVNWGGILKCYAQ